MITILAAASVYFLALRPDGRPAAKPLPHTRCWRVVSCQNRHRFPEGQIICGSGSSQVRAWLRKERTMRRCALGRQVK
jgi:hypothetical protein